MVFTDNPVNQPAVGIFPENDAITRRDCIISFTRIIKAEWNDGDLIASPDKRVHAQSTRLDPDRDFTIQ